MTTEDWQRHLISCNAVLSALALLRQRPADQIVQRESCEADLSEGVDGDLPEVSSRFSSN